MTEKALVLQSNDDIACIRGSIHGDEFEVIVIGNGNVTLLFGDQLEHINWIVEQRRIQRERQS